MLIPRRKLLLGGGAALGATLAAQRAEADTAFPNYAFTATGSTTPRTMPDRLAEEKNVLNYGAYTDNTNAAATTAAIQAAVDAAVADGTGVYVPPGIYAVTNSGSGSAILLNTDADFGFYMRGVAGASLIQSNACPGYIIDRSLGTPNNTIGPRVFEGLSFSNSTISPSTGGCLRVGSSIGVIAKNCSFGASGIGLTTEDAPGVSSQNITLEACTFVSSGQLTTSMGLVMGGSGVMINCDFAECATAAVLYGKGISVMGSRCESSTTGFKLGVDSAGTDQGLNGFSLMAEEMEGVTTAVDFLGTVTGFSIQCGSLGHQYFNSGGQGHQINTQYGYRIRANKAYYGEFVNSSGTETFDVGIFYMEDYSTPKRSFITFSNCYPSLSVGAGVPWSIPASSGWPLFLACRGISSDVGPPYGTRYLYAGLPTGGDVFEGDEFDISDATTSTIGATVTTGGGSNCIHVRWNGTNWICLPG